MVDSALEPSYKVEKSFITAMDTEIDIDMVNDPTPLYSSYKMWQVFLNILWRIFFEYNVIFS